MVPAEGMLRCHFQPSAGLSGSTDGELEQGRATLLLPAGRCVVDLDTTMYEPVQREIDLAPGDNALEIRLVRRPLLELTLRDGDTIVRCSRDGLLIEPVGRSGAVAGIAELRDRRMRVAFTGEGTYRVTPPQLQGYLAVAPFEVTVGPNAIEQRTISLVRE
jgi:hypothetical protein